MRARTVTTPSGETWRVGRVWIGRPLPRWRRISLRGVPSAAAREAPVPLDAEQLAGLVVAAVATVVLGLVLVPLLLFGFELVIVGSLAALGILGRGLLGRPWLVRARTGSEGGRELSWRVVGLRRSRRLIDEVATSLADGRVPVPAEPCEEAVLAAGPK